MHYQIFIYLIIRTAEYSFKQIIILPRENVFLWFTYYEYFSNKNSIKMYTTINCFLGNSLKYYIVHYNINKWTLSWIFAIVNQQSLSFQVSLSIKKKLSPINNFLKMDNSSNVPKTNDTYWYDVTSSFYKNHTVSKYRRIVFSITQNNLYSKDYKLFLLLFSLSENSHTMTRWSALIYCFVINY